MENESLMDVTAVIDMAMWSAAFIGAGVAALRWIGELLGGIDALSSIPGVEDPRQLGQFLDGFLVVLAALLTGVCAYQLVTQQAAAMENLLFWFAAATAILCGISGMILLRANSNDS